MKAQKNPFISVIVPVYNAEMYLKRCIDSILEQSIQDFELILINDGSNDNSLLVIEECAKCDKRIIVINQENCGVSAARNNGLKIATGKFILFVDSDDYIAPNYISSFIQNKDIDPTINLIIQGCTWYMDGRERKYICKKGYYSKNEFAEALSEYEMFRHGSPYGKLYSQKIIKENNIFFNTDIRNYEDLLFFFEYIRYIEGLYFIEETGYHYNVLDGGLHSKDSGICGEERLFQQYVYYTKCYWNIPNSKVYSYTKILLIRLINVYKKYLDNKNLKENLCKIIVDYKYVFQAPNSGIRKKDILFLYLIRFRLFRMAFSFQSFYSHIKK